MEISKENPTIHIVTQSFDGPHKAEVVTFDEVYPMPIGNGRKWSAEEVEVKLSALLQHAIYSGFNVTVSNESDPRLGTGGYRPRIDIRPDHKTARAKMAEAAALQDHFEKHGCHGFTVAEPNLEEGGGDA